MAYNPQYCTIVVRNDDGSGYLRQFETLAEAKAAYAAISTHNASVYLYQPPTKSLSNNPPSTPPPISSSDTEETQSGILRRIFDFTSNENTTVEKSTKIGCGIIQIKDVDNVTIMSASAPRYRYDYISNGQPASYEENGEVNTNGCYYPAGFKIDTTASLDVYSTKFQTIYSLDYNGNVWGPYYNVISIKSIEREYIVADGDGQTHIEKTIGIPIIENNILTWENYLEGDIPYKLGNGSFSNRERVGHPIPNGNYLVTYKVAGDDTIHSGYWSASVTTSGDSTDIIWKFTPLDPSQPPPPPCSISRKFLNQNTGNVEDECDPTIVYPFTVEEDCEPPVVVTIDGQEITLGENKKTGMNNGYGEITWGPCSGMIYIPNGTLILSSGNINYFSNGQGGYYAEGGNDCPSQGTVLSENTTDILVEIGSNNYSVGYSYERTIADGNCGSGLETGSEYTPNGTLIVSYNDNNYYSNGSGGYYNCQVSGTLISSVDNPALIMITETGNIAQIGTYSSSTYANGECGTYTTDGDITYYSFGTNIGSGNGYNFFSNGVGGYYSEPIVICDDYGTLLSSQQQGYSNIYISEIENSYDAGSYYEETYADGNCGTYTSYVTYWFPSGTILAFDSSNNYLSDGSGGYTVQPITVCDEYGYYYGTTTEPSTVLITELNGYYTMGTYDISSYADGSCGTYSESGSTSWYANGTFITSDSSNNYFSNGEGGYYSEPIQGCESFGVLIETSSGTHTVDVGCGNWQVGTWQSSTYADGACGTYTNNESSYEPYGLFIGNCSDYNYYSDGNGNVYQGEYTGTPCSESGTFISEDSGINYIYISELESSYANGTWTTSTYADGTCGTYTNNSTTYLPYGEVFANSGDGMYSYNSDGNGGYYINTL